MREKDEQAYKKQKAIACEAVSFNGTFKLGQPVKNGTFEKSSGLLIVDLDHLEDVHLAKSDLITKPNIVFCFISPSGDGLKLGVRVDASLINNDADFKQAYFQIESIFKAWGYETDPACKDISRKCFLCHDADVFYNPDADICKLKPFQEIAPKAPPIRKEYTANSNEGDYLQKCINIILSAESRERHVARRNAGNALGHYVASGKLDVKNEDDYINALITASDQIAGNDDDDRTSEKEIKTIKSGYQYGLLHHSEQEAWEYDNDLTLLKNIESIPLPAPDKAVYSIIAKAVQAHPITSYKDTITALEDRMGCKLSGSHKSWLKKLLREQDEATRKYHTVTTDSLPEFDINSYDAAKRMLSEGEGSIFVDMRPMGSGKTLFTALLWKYLQMINKTFGYISHRASIITATANRLDIEHYNEVSPGEFVPVIGRLRE
ncbi:BT4734/BF3469 family protein [Bathymodiolus japonicus methanotrophic gill symbiont]|uniref:BT4734/BF3469 family protein n=1 Tax=Bathymodiolus japonicus methanotrophic gill symbiont TaxID=113269 RepID=UPI001C8E1489|nr:BT4734/BF3469 family protein [Bathymodiolus japonicus methanotrophic gill symbiont]